MKLRVKEHNHLDHDNEQYPAGTELEGDEKMLAAMPWALEKVKAPKAEKSEEPTGGNKGKGPAPKSEEPTGGAK